MSGVNVNNFYFSGRVYSAPETRTFQSNAKTTFMIEQTSEYKGVPKTTVVSVNAWHKGSSHTQQLKVGDMVLVMGKFTSNPYKEKHIVNMDAMSVVAMGNQGEVKPVMGQDDGIPF